MYEQFYGFSECPFGITPDPRFLYMAPSHFEAFSSMLSGIKERKGITVITGPVGVGKTTLIHALLKDLSEKIKTAFIFFSSITFSQLMKQVLTDLGQPADENDLYGLLQSFRRYLSERLASDEKVAIIIDEAHMLDDGVIRDVARLVTHPHPSANILKIVLVGQPELEEKLDREEMKGLTNVISLQRRIKALSIAESKTYIDHRLRVAGSRTNSVFTPEAVERICGFARGIPRVINLTCDAILVDGFAKQTRTIDDRIVMEVIKDLSHLDGGPPRRQRWAVPSLRASLGDRITTRRALAVSGATIASALLVTLSLLGVSYVRKEIDTRQSFYVDRQGQKGVEVKPPAETQPARADHTITVEKGSTLVQLTRRHYGRTSPTILDMVCEANPSITDIDLIYAKQGIVMPPLSADSFVVPGRDDRYTVYLGTYVHKPPIGTFQDEPTLKGKTIEIIERTVSPRETWYRVMAGQFATKEEGLQTLSALRLKGFLAGG